MMIPFKCPHCKKPLRVKKELAGKRAACPACKKPIVIPAPMAAPADLEAFAAAALIEEQAAKEEVALKPVKFTCSWCDEEVEVAADLAGKQTPCPACKRIVKVPLPKADKPKDWRELAKQGPAAALINQPEQLDGAWGTEFKGRVSRTALEEAEALPEVEIEPIGVRGWIRRGAIAAAVLAAVSLLFFMAMRQRTARRQNDAVREALSLVEAKKGDKEWKDRLLVLTSVIHSVDGQLKLRDEKPVTEAWNAFKTAWMVFPRADNVKEANLDHDLFLIDLAIAQLGLAGTKDQVFAQTRIEWGPVKDQIDQTLRRIKAPEARQVAAREVAGALLFLDQPQLAINAPSVMINSGDSSFAQSAALPQQNALLFALGDEKAAQAAMGKSDPKKETKKKEITPGTRYAMAEGHAWKGELAEARKYVEEPGPDYHKYHAAVGVASVLLANKKNTEGAKQAAPFVADAIKWSKGVLNKWPVLQLVRIAARTDQAGQVQEHVKNLDPPFKRRAQLELFLAHLDKAGADVDVDQLLAQLPDKEGPNRALAWLAVNRHLAHHGLAARMPEGEDADFEAFAKLGLALGGQDRRAE